MFKLLCKQFKMKLEISDLRGLLNITVIMKKKKNTAELLLQQSPV